MSVAAPRGWLAAGVRAGTKPSGDLDLALVLSERPAAVAGAFTTNKVVGAPVTVSKPRAAAGRSRGFVVSAGIANVSTGEQGIRDAEAMAAAAASACGCAPDDFLCSCTGLIGGLLPMDVVLAGIDDAARRLSPEGAEDAARAICTTDTRPKQAVRTLEIGGRTVGVGGMAKGAGMIAPDLKQATMLAFLTSDAQADAAALRSVLGAGLERTFNAITIDGCTSTSDTVLLFANGASEVDVSGSREFAAAVHGVMADLAYQVVSDGEGATKVVRIRVEGAAGQADARRAARAVADSLLVRCAMAGGDPNWGRIAQALGAAGADLDPEALRIAIGGVDVADRGVGTGRETEAARTLRAEEVLIEADLGVGTHSAEVLTCDLTPEYVKFNAEYTT